MNPFKTRGKLDSWSWKHIGFFSTRKSCTGIC